MQVIDAINTEDALRQGLRLLRTYGLQAGSRNGPVVVAPWPVMTVTHRPRQRVVRASWRDANPFFHLVEAAWMLAGRRDAADLTPYVKRFSQYAQDDGIIHGAYGWRWRTALGIDQLNVVVRRLKMDPNDRQCVLQMWDANIVGDAANNDLAGAWHDRPCNTHAYVRLRPVQWDDEPQQGTDWFLDLTVCCRSNDMLWGAHGANAVHFSYLQEYLADRLGVAVGTMYQLSNNYHAYVSELDRVVRRWRNNNTASWHRDGDGIWVAEDRLGYRAVQPVRLQGEAALDSELPELWHHLSTTMHSSDPPAHVAFATAFCRLVWNAALAHRYWKDGHGDAARRAVDRIDAHDWREACAMWLDRHDHARAEETAHAGA